MPDERTRRFDRLLAMREQLERLAQWRLAAARRERIEAEEMVRGLELAIADDRTARGDLLTCICDPAAVRAAIAIENQGLVRLVEERAVVHQRMTAEAAVEEAFLAAQRRTRQSEKLSERAHEIVNAQEQLALQLEWDEHGLRTGGRLDFVDVATEPSAIDDVHEEMESRP